MPGKRSPPLKILYDYHNNQILIDIAIMQAALLLIALLIGTIEGRECPQIQSCSKEALSSDVDPCCVPSPSGLFVFRQRFEPDVGGDMGSWGIDGLEVLE